MQKIWENRDVKVLGINIDNELKFDKHILEICSETRRKLGALVQISKLVSFSKTKNFI